jgi:predicted Ser/Thr protein kinase
LQAYDARRGTVVRVKDAHWKSEFRGMHGTIQWLSGQSEHAVVEVLLEDGRRELFWLPNVEAIEQDIAV